MSSIRAVFSLLPAFVSMAACSFIPNDQSSLRSDIDVGTNTLGERCTLQPTELDLPLTDAGTTYDLMCGDWTQPSGRIYQLSTKTDRRSLASSGAWAARLGSIAYCDEPADLDPSDGLQAIELTCRLRMGRWPYFGLVAQINGKTYLADSVPVAYDVLVEGINVLNGGDVRAPRLPRSLAAKKFRLDTADYSAGDLQKYRDLLLLAQHFNYLGQFAVAEKLYRDALNLQEQYPSDDGGRAFLEMHIALELSNQERFQEAEARFDVARKRVSTSTVRTDQARLLGYRAIHAANRQRNDEALKHARDATRLRRSLAKATFRPIVPAAMPNQFSARRFVVSTAATSDRNPLTYAQNLGDEALSREATANGDLVQSLSLEAALLIRSGDLDNAENVLDEAIDKLWDEPRLPRRWAPQLQRHQAQIAESRADLEGAERLLLASIDGQRALFVDSRGEGLMLLALGNVAAQQNRPREALGHYRKGFDLLAKEGSGAFPIDAAVNYFKTAMSIAQGQPRQQQQQIYADMFSVAQQAKGLVTARAMAMAAARVVSGNQDVANAIRKMQDTRRRRDQLHTQIAVARANPVSFMPAAVNELEEKVRFLTDEIAKLDFHVQNAHPRYNQLLDRSIKIKKMQETLQEKEAFLQILVGNDRSFGFFVNQTHIEAYEISLTRAEIKTAVRDIRKSLNKEGAISPFDLQSSYDLYSHLFEPIQSHLKSVQHIIISPSSELLSLPFGVLATSPPPRDAETKNITRRNQIYNETAWLVRRFALTLAPSAQSLFNLRTVARPSAATEPFIGFGYDQHYKRQIETAESNGGVKSFDLPDNCKDKFAQFTRFAPLTELEPTLQQMKQQIGAPEAPLLVGNQFSEKNFPKDLDKYRSLVFVTHGLLPNQLDCMPEPALLTGGEDRYLTASEIAELKLDADIAMLLACNTGGPDGNFSGEALAGLARSFLYAGARSVLVTHWEVPHKPTLDLSIHVAKNVDQSLAFALRQSQVALINDPDFAHPINWGAFTIVGDGGVALD